MTAPLLPTWPGGARAAVSLTFDVDSDAVLPPPEPGRPQRLVHRSLFRYGVARGLPRLLELLDRRGVPGTFYVPGETARVHAAAVAEIVTAGHEIGHHGHHHLRPDELTPARQREEVERGLVSLADVLGVVPRGYRAPFAELTPETLELLIAHGFAWDSSCMGDDRPYVERHGALELLELPIHWALDDAPYFLCTLDSAGLLRDPAEVVGIWAAEIADAVRERRHVTLVMHPEIMGRAPQAAALERLIDQLLEAGTVWFATHGQVVERLTAATPAAAVATAAAASPR